MIRRLTKEDMNEIMELERKAFIPPIQTTEAKIRERLSKEHVYLGTEVDGKLVGTLALRYAYFEPDFKDFLKRYPTFDDYAERSNDENANAVFVYSIGVLPHYRNSINARRLLTGALKEAVEKNMDYLVGDARIPSYNGSYDYPDFEKFEKNEEVHRAVNEYLKTGKLPSREVIEKDPVAGFYLKVFPEGKILGITDDNFWKGDKPCGGHMVIEYLRLIK